MNLYAESSAVLAWLLGESVQAKVVTALQGAEHIYTSALTPVECARGLAVARRSDRITQVEELAALRVLDYALTSWNVYDVSEDVLHGARSQFPAEPVRTLDAIHLATAVRIRTALRDLTMCSLDQRIRQNADSLGIPLTPLSATSKA